MMINFMKKFLGFILCFAMILCFALPALAATSCEEWVDDFKKENSIEELKEKYRDNQGYFEFKEAYPAYHIKDDAFFEKLLLGAKMSSFISEEYYVGLFMDFDPEEFEFIEDPYVTFRIYDSKIEKQIDFFYSTKITHEQFASFASGVDGSVNDGDLGEVKNLSFLYYDLENRRYAGKKIPEGSVMKMVIWFVYIDSDKGEFFVPYVIKQDGGETFLENGKIYTLKECAKIMKEAVYVRKDSLTETVDVVYPWQIALIAVVGVAAAVGLFFGGKALIVYNQTRRRGGHHYY